MNGERDAGVGLASLFWRVFVLNAVVFAAGTAVLVLTPITVSSPAAITEVLILAAGGTVMLVANAVLLRWALAPLQRLRRLMEQVDLLRPGQRLPVTPVGEFAPLVHGFNDMMARLEGERRESAARALDAVEAERRRLARDLHDEVGQLLTAVLLRLKRVHARAPDTIRDDLVEVQETVRDSLDEIREILHRLRPGVLQDLGLLAAVDALTGGFTDKTGIPVERHLESPLPALDEHVELALYRIVQESLTNIARHARASRVAVALALAGDEVVLTVSDDGRGIDAGTPEGGGIRGMRERALHVGGELEVTSGPDGGTRVTVSVLVVRAPARRDALPPKDSPDDAPDPGGGDVRPAASPGASR